MCMPPFNPMTCSPSATRKVAFGVDLEDLERILTIVSMRSVPHRVPRSGNTCCCQTANLPVGSTIRMAILGPRASRSF